MPDPTLCASCGTTLWTRLERERRCCDACAVKSGVAVLAASQRPRVPCTKCQCPHLIRAVPRELADRDGRATAGPMFAAYQVALGNPIDTRSGFGIFEVYICKQCGFVEWYCQNPLEVPIGPQYMTEEFDAHAAMPYR